MDRPQSKRRQTLRLSQRQALNVPSTCGGFLSETGNASTSHSVQPESKVPIPRLHRPGPKPALPDHDRRRVSHACEPCRRKKAKCDGRQPVCSRCKDHDIQCFYADSKRDKLKRSTRYMASKLTLYERLLSELLPIHDSSVQQEIRNALDENHYLVGEDTVQASGINAVSGDEANDELLGFTTSSSVHFRNSTENPSAFDVGPSGFLGKASVVRWTEEALDRIITENSTYLFVRSPSFLHTLREMNGVSNVDEFKRILLAGCTYFSDDVDLGELSMLNNTVDAFQLPPKSVADMLIGSYFSTVQPICPILSESDFMARYHTYLQTKKTPDGSYTWIAVLNIVFAIGSLYAHYIQATCDLTDNHTIFWVRSHSLIQGARQVPNLPTLEHIQLSTMTGLYFISRYQINRAWHLIGMGVRDAYTRALHLVDDTPNVPDEEKKAEIRLWHSLCSIEQLLAVLTGRPPALHEPFISNSRFPTAHEPDFSTSNLFVGETAIQETTTPVDTSIACVAGTGSALAWNTFNAGRRLDAIIMDTLTALYSATTVNHTWWRVQRLVARLDSRLSHWMTELAPGVLILPDTNNPSRYPLRERMYLSLRFFATSMLIHQPCLREAGELYLASPSRSETSKRMDAESAARCISSARGLIKIFPIDISAVSFYRTTPWWCALHYVIQAGVILMMEISYDAPHTPPAEVPSLVNESCLVLRLLCTLSPTSYSAHRAWLSLSRLLRLALAKTGRDPGNAMLYMSDTSVVAQHATTPPFQPQGSSFPANQALPDWQQSPPLWRSNPF